MHALLIRPPALFSKSAYTAVVTMPIAIAYLAGYLRKFRGAVRVIDALGEGMDHVGSSCVPTLRYRGLSDNAILERVSFDTRWIGISSMFSQDWPHIEQLIAQIHSAFPEVPILLGGEHATAASDFILKTCPGVFAVAMGEGEEVCRLFDEYMGGDRPLESVSGLKYRTATGLMTNEPRPQIHPDDIPWPAWDLFDLNPYFEKAPDLLGLGVYKGREMPLLATRGCPYRCSFCSSPQMWTTFYRMRKADDVVDEIAHYVRTYQICNIQFFDLTAIVNRRWILDFCERLTERKLPITWQLPNGTRSEALDRDVLIRMRQAGCSNLCYAPESGSERVLQSVKKKISLPRMIRSIGEAKKLGFYVKCNMILGFPKEKRKDIYRTLLLAVKMAWLGVDDTNIFLFSPYPGSELFSSLEREGKIRRMDGGYFKSLLCFLDMKIPSVYCEKVGPRELWFYRTLGLCLFYLLTYLFHPLRMIRGIRNFYCNTPYTKWETKIFQMVRPWPARS